MIEITAKQLYDIYKFLPDAKEWKSQRGYECYSATIHPDFQLYVQLKIPVPESVSVDFIVCEGYADGIKLQTEIFEWKPTTDLIIKA